MAFQILKEHYQNNLFENSLTLFLVYYRDNIYINICLLKTLKLFIYTPFHCIICLSQNFSTKTDDSKEPKLMTRNKWSAIVYRRGQKQLTRLFLQEAEHALQLSLNEEEVTSC